MARSSARSGTYVSESIMKVSVNLKPESSPSFIQKAFSDALSQMLLHLKRCVIFLALASSSSRSFLPVSGPPTALHELLYSPDLFGVLQYDCYIIKLHLCSKAPDVVCERKCRASFACESATHFLHL